MNRRRSNEWPPPLRPYLIALGIIAALALVVYYAFNPGVPFASGYRIEAVFETSNGLRKGSPVRIAGADVGKVVEIGKGPGTTTLVTLRLDDDGRPVHRDAVARIRPRVFLEGGYLVELSPGSPSAPELPDDGTLPLSQTAVPVQFHHFLTVFDHPTRASLREGLDSLATALDDGGARGLRKLAPQLRPLMRDLAWVGEAAQGERPDDMSRLIAATERISRALDAEGGRAGSLVQHLATVAEAVRSRDAQLADTIAELRLVLRETPRATAALDTALPRLERAAAHVTPAMEIAPEALGETASVLRKLGRLVAPGRRERTLASLETAFVDLPDLVGRLAQTFPSTKPLTDCLSSHILPLFESEVPDGGLSTARPVWQDFAHALVGLSSASQTFDGNGHSLRYQFGIGDQSLSTAVVPGFGPLLANAPSSLQSRPLPRADRKPPPIDMSKPCSSQPQPELETASGPAGLTAVSRAERADTLSVQEFRALLRPRTLRRLLGGAE